MRKAKFEIAFNGLGVAEHPPWATAGYKTLVQAKHDIEAENARLLDAATREERGLTDQERRKSDTLFGELAVVQRELRAIEAEQAPVESVRPRGGARFADLFGQERARDWGGFESAEDYLKTVHAGLADQRLTPTIYAVNTGVIPTEGGFSVPSGIFSSWLDHSLETEIVRPLADVRPMTAPAMKAPAWGGDTHTSTLYGGFSGGWYDENSTITTETPTLRLIELRARKLAILAAASNELIADGIGFEEQLGQAITRAMGWYLDSAFLAGAGAPGPLGVLNAPATITVAKESGQVASTIVYANVAKMFARLTPGSHTNPSTAWVCNSAAIPQLLQLSMPVGTGGSHIPVMNERDGQFRMLGIPVKFTEKVPTLGTIGDIMLCDFSQYLIGVRAEFSLQKSAHAGFADDITYYRGTLRVDGQPKPAAATTPYAGDTLSPFVKLATRS